MRKNLAIIALTAAALLAVLFMVFQLHQTSKEKVLSQFNEHQLLIAKQVASQIESYFRSCSQDLRWLSSHAHLQGTDREEMVSDVQANFERIDEESRQGDIASRR